MDKEYDYNDQSTPETEDEQLSIQEEEQWRNFCQERDYLELVGYENHYWNRILIL